MAGLGAAATGAAGTPSELLARTLLEPPSTTASSLTPSTFSGAGADAADGTPGASGSVHDVRMDAVAASRAFLPTQAHSQTPTTTNTISYTHIKLLK